MWNLSKLKAEEYGDHLKVAFPGPPAGEELSDGDLGRVVEYYDLYVLKAGRPCDELLGRDVPAPIRKKVHDAYALIQEGRRLGALRSAIKLLATQCPYCGYGPIEDLDHLLPRAQYKLFSIFALNLVPSCSTCNRKKRRKSSKNPAEHQIHTYLEDVSGFNFLTVKVDIDPESGALQATYSIEPPTGMPKDLSARLRNHMSEFDLQNRYIRQVNIFLGEQEYMIRSAFDSGGPDGLRLTLGSSADALAKRFGFNDYRSALMRGLANCEEFWNGGFRRALGITSAEGN